MSTFSSHQTVQALLGVYALDAVDPDEANVVELHLRDCPSCRAELGDHRETASVLAGGHSLAPTELWGRIVTSLEEAPPEQLASVLPLKRRRAGQRLMLAVTSAAAVAVALFGVSLVQQDQRLGEMQSALEDKTLLAAALAAHCDPDARRTDLRSADGHSRWSEMCWVLLLLKRARAV